MKINTRNLVENSDRFLFIFLTSKPNLKFCHQTKFIITPFQQCCFQPEYDFNWKIRFFFNSAAVLYLSGQASAISFGSHGFDFFFWRRDMLRNINSLLGKQGLVYMEKSCPQWKGHPTNRANLSESLYAKKDDPFNPPHQRSACSDCLKERSRMF